MNIKHLFFDLDRTLWDFETNSFNSLLRLEISPSKSGAVRPISFNISIATINYPFFLRLH